MSVDLPLAWAQSEPLRYFITDISINKVTSCHWNFRILIHCHGLPMSIWIIRVLLLKAGLILMVRGSLGQ